MNEPSTTAELMVAFTEAWSSGDMDAVRPLVAEDVHFESPLVELTGVDPYLAAVGEFAQLVTHVDIVAVAGAEDSAIVMYDMTTGPFGTVRVAEHLVFENGRVTTDQLVFDTYAVRTAQETQP